MSGVGIKSVKVIKVYTRKSSSFIANDPRKLYAPDTGYEHFCSDAAYLLFD